MKLTSLLALLVACVAFTGCESLSDATSGVREKFAARNEPRTKTFSGPPRVVFEAVRAAANGMGYRMTRGGPAQGEFEGISGVDVGDTAGSARQVGIKVRLHATLDGNDTEVSVRFTEILEQNAGGGRGLATETTMRDTPLYEVYFRRVQQALGTRPSAQPVQPASGSGS